MTKILGELWDQMLEKECREDLISDLETAIKSYANLEWIEAKVEFFRSEKFFVVSRIGMTEKIMFRGKLP
jgi:hypothetical protein